MSLASPQIQALPRNEHQGMNNDTQIKQIVHPEVNIGDSEDMDGFKLSESSGISQHLDINYPDSDDNGHDSSDDGHDLDDNGHDLNDHVHDWCDGHDMDARDDNLGENHGALDDNDQNSGDNVIEMDDELDFHTIHRNSPATYKSAKIYANWMSVSCSFLCLKQQPLLVFAHTCR